MTKIKGNYIALFAAWFLVIISGCASLQGQVAGMGYLALPQYYPAALPKEKTGDEAVISKPIPVIGQIIIGKNNMHAERIRHGFLYNWFGQDPKEYVTITPNFTAVTNNLANGFLMPAAGSLKHSVGIKLSAGDKGIPIGKGNVLTLNLAANSDLNLNNMRFAEIDLMNFDFISTLVNSYDGRNPVYFVNEVLTSDAINLSEIGAKIKYAAPVKAPGDMNIDPTIQLMSSRDYRGVGLIIGVKFQKVEIGSAQKGRNLSENFENKFHDEFGGKYDPERVFNTQPLAHKKVRVIFIPKGVMPKEQKVECTTVSQQTATADFVDLPEGSHTVRYFAVGGNKLYAVQVVLSISQKVNGALELKESQNDRITQILSWQAVDPQDILIPDLPPPVDITSPQRKDEDGLVFERTVWKNSYLAPNGDFKGEIEYFVRNASRGVSIDTLPRFEATWSGSNLPQPKIDAVIYGDKKEAYSIIPGPLTVETRQNPYLDGQQRTESKYSQPFEIRPALGPQQSLHYGIRVETKGTELEAFTSEGSFIGMWSIFKVDEMELQADAPEGFIFKEKAHFVRDKAGYTPFMPNLSAPKLSDGDKRIIWKVTNPNLYLQYLIKASIVKTN